MLKRNSARGLSESSSNSNPRQCCARDYPGDGVLNGGDFRVKAAKHTLGTWVLADAYCSVLAWRQAATID
jgi:hypothetical protein